MPTPPALRLPPQLGLPPQHYTIFFSPPNSGLFGNSLPPQLKLGGCKLCHLKAGNKVDEALSPELHLGFDTFWNPPPARIGGGGFKLYGSVAIGNSNSKCSYVYRSSYCAMHLQDVIVMKMVFIGSLVELTTS